MLSHVQADVASQTEGFSLNMWFREMTQAGGATEAILIIWQFNVFQLASPSVMELTGQAAPPAAPLSSVRLV